MKYIRIKNNGIIEPDALHLVGVSTKRNDASKIGQFGSGNKYALAFFLRENYGLKVFAGNDEIQITTQPRTFRKETFDVVFINGRETSISTGMGKDWEFWQAIREIYCNALDEGGAELDFVQNIHPHENETHFYIENKGPATQFITDFDDYFATKKEVLFECRTGRILKKSGKNANVYRKGIRCATINRTSVFDYDFNEITIDEDRLVKYSWQIEEKMWEIILKCDNEEIIMSILHKSSDSNYIEANISSVTDIHGSHASEKFVEVFKTNRVAPAGFAGLLKADEVHNHIVIPTKVFDAMRGYVRDSSVGDKFKYGIKGGVFREIELTPLWEATVNKALDFFKECQFEIPFPIRFAIFEDKSTFGAACDGTIYLSDIVMDRGVNEVCNTIMEEFIHCKYQVADETRDFQTDMIAEFLSYMKKVNAYVI